MIPISTVIKKTADPTGSRSQRSSKCHRPENRAGFHPGRFVHSQSWVWESQGVAAYPSRFGHTRDNQGYPRIVSGSVNHLGLQVSSLLQDCHSSAFFLCRSTLSLDSWHSQRCEQKMTRTKESRFCSWKHWNNWMNMIENDQSTLCHWLCPSLIVCQTDADIWITGCFAKQMEIVAIEPAAFNDLTPIRSIQKGEQNMEKPKNNHDMDYITLTFRISSKTIKPSERDCQGAVTLRTPTGFGSRKVAVSTISSLAQNAQDLLSGLLAHQFPLSEASHQESWNYRLKMPNNRRFILAMTSCTSCHLAKSHNSISHKALSKSCSVFGQVSFCKNGRNQTLGNTKRFAINFSKIRVSPRSLSSSSAMDASCVKSISRSGGSRK